MLFPRALPLPVQAPAPPDRWLCSPTYGRSISAHECAVLIDWTWPSGGKPIHYYFEDPAPSNGVRLPKTDKMRSCQVSIEAAGPVHQYPAHFMWSPDEMRGWAGWVVQQCVREGGGIGGFVTVGFGSAEAYVQSVANDWVDDMQNVTDGRITNGAFLTISVNGMNKTGFAPGDTDPDVAGHLSSYTVYLSMLFAEKRMAYHEFACFLRDRAISMLRGGAGRWWTAREGDSRQQPDQENGNMMPSALTTTTTTTSRVSNHPKLQGQVFDAGEMTYECDGNLGVGGPEPVDCEKLGWSGLSSDPDAEVELQKGVPRFWSEGTCTLALSSTLSTTITWAHILAAFDTLNNLCVQNPIRAIKGGRAYYGPQAVSSWVNGKKKAKAKRKRFDSSRRDTIGAVDGSTALPAGLNVTVFRNAGPGKLSCEWVLAQQGKNVSMCDRG